LHSISPCIPLSSPASLLHLTPPLRSLVIPRVHSPFSLAQRHHQCSTGPSRRVGRPRSRLDLAGWSGTGSAQNQWPQWCLWRQALLRLQLVGSAPTNCRCSGACSGWFCTGEASHVVEGVSGTLQWKPRGFSWGTNARCLHHVAEAIGKPRPPSELLALLWGSSSRPMEYVLLPVRDAS
jgi:hypothetical protein